jgi:hypothetical protein
MLTLGERRQNSTVDTCSPALAWTHLVHSDEVEASGALLSKTSRSTSASPGYLTAGTLMDSVHEPSKKEVVQKHATDFQPLGRDIPTVLHQDSHLWASWPPIRSTEVGPSSCPGPSTSSEGSLTRDESRR